MNYLENSICNFTPLFDIDYGVKKNIITCSMFKMFNRGYKDFNEYVKGLFTLYNCVQKNSEKFRNKYCIRLFIDDSIHRDTQLMKSLRKMPKIELVLFHCPEYLDKNNSGYHVGLIGTMIRFFPMFDFPNNDAETIIISDIDTMSDLVKRMTIVELMQNANKINGLYILKIGNLGKNAKFLYPSLYKNKIGVYSFAPSVISFKKINQCVIVDFIQDIKQTKKFYSYYYDLQKSEDTENARRRYENLESFVYGIDEYFLNKTMIEYVIDNEIPYATNLIWNVMASIYYYFIYDFMFTQEYKNILGNLFDHILEKNKLTMKPECKLIDKFNKIDRIIYSKSKSCQKLAYNINLTLYNIFMKNYTTEQLRFIYPKEFYTILVDTKLFGLYDFSMIHYEFSEYTDLIISKKTFKDRDQQHLDRLRMKHATEKHATEKHTT